ncbi:hypothetical protein FOVSG1_011221 [Fusarium oxysporum f. sp. vasinfectum]
MTSITVESELMTQTVAAQPINNASDFFVVKDAGNHPMLFSRGDQGELYLTLQGKSGINQLVNLGAKFNIPSSSTIAALSVKQSLSGTTFLIFAERSSQAKNDKLHVVKGVDPQDVNWIDSTDLTKYLLEDASGQNKALADKVATIHQFHLGTGEDKSVYPELTVEYGDSAQMLQDIVSVTVSSDGKSWTYESSFVLPEAARLGQMSALSSASMFDYRGLFCLYPMSDSQHLTFVAPDTETKKQIQVMHDVTGMNVQCIATLPQSDGNTGVVFGSATGIHYFSAKEAIKKAAKPQVLSTDRAFANPTVLYLSRTDSVISIWAANGNNELVYQEFDAQLQPIAPAVTLLSSSDGGRFAALNHPTETFQQQLFVLSGRGNVTMLEQSRTSRLWSRTPYLVPSTGSNYDYTSFTTHITITDQNGNPPFASKPGDLKMLLSCDGTLSVTCNGEARVITAVGTEIPVDDMGTITIMTPTDDISTPMFRLNNVPGSPKLLLDTEITIDPAKKVKDRISKIHSADSLKAEAGSILQPDITPETLDKAGTAIGKLHSHISLLSSDSTSQSPPAPVMGADSSVLSTLWDAWEAIQNGLRKVFEFGFEVLDGVMHFAITVAEGVLKFALTTVEYCFKAISWVLTNVLHIDISKLVKWLGFVFGWQDVIDTQIVFSKGVNKFLDLVQDVVPQWCDKASSWLDETEDDIQALLNKALPPDVGSKQQTTQNIKELGDSDPTITNARNSPGANWLQYNLRHGSAGQSLVAAGNKEDDDLLTDNRNPLADLFDLAKDAFSTIFSIIKDVFEGVFKLFQGEFTLENVRTTLVKMLQKIVKDGFVGLKKMLKDTSTLLVDVIAAFQKIANKSLPELPLISPLWKSISGGQEFTVINVVGLLLALPTTVMTKLVTGKPPSKFEGYSELCSMLGIDAKTTLTSQQKVPQAINSVFLATSASDGSVSQISKLTQLLSSIGRLGAPCGNLISMFISAAGWAAPDIDTPWYTYVISLFMSIISFPSDVEKPVRPVFSMRYWEWVMGFFSIVFLEEKNKTVRASLLMVPVGIKAIPIVISLIMDFNADKNEYPALDYGSLWAFEVNRLIGWATDMANLFAIQARGVDEVADIAYFFLGLAGLGFGGWNVATRTMAGDYEPAAHTPPVTLPY